MSAATDFFLKADLFFQTYWEGRYADALALAEELAIQYPEKDARTAFWLICMQNLTGQAERALQTFQEALARGVWWSEDLLRSDPDLSSLQGNDDFERLLKRSEEMHLQMEANAVPALSVHQPQGKGPFPLLVVLGPRAGYPELDLRDWSPVLGLGWMLALPLSTQMASPLAHVWDDRERAWNEILLHLETLAGKYPIDRDRIVLAGFSQGAARAMELVLSRQAAARGFFAVTPGTLNMAEVDGWADSSTARGVLVAGGKDPRHAMFIQIREICSKRNLPLLFEDFPEMAHQIPADFESVLQKGLEFILKEQE